MLIQVYNFFVIIPQNKRECLQLFSHVPVDPVNPLRHHLWIRGPKQRFMEVTAVVLHGGALAHYDVEVQNDGICTAHLARFNGSPDRTPPQDIILRRDGRRWVSDISDTDLSEDIGYAIEMKVPEEIILNNNRKRGGNPAE